MNAIYTYDAYHGAGCVPLWRHVPLTMPDASTPAQIVRRCKRDAERHGREVRSVRRVTEREGREVWEAVA